MLSETIEGFKGLLSVIVNVAVVAITSAGKPFALVAEPETVTVAVRFSPCISGIDSVIEPSLLAVGGVMDVTVMPLVATAVSFKVAQLRSPTVVAVKGKVTTCSVSTA